MVSCLGTGRHLTEDHCANNGLFSNGWLRSPSSRTNKRAALFLHAEPGLSHPMGALGPGSVRFLTNLAYDGSHSSHAYSRPLRFSYIDPCSFIETLRYSEARAYFIPQCSRSYSSIMTKMVANCLITMQRRPGPTSAEDPGKPQQSKSQ